MLDHASPPPGGSRGLTLKQQVVFWLVAAAVFIALLWLLSDVLLPFVAGMALAYLLDPLVGRIQRLGINRQLAAVILVLVVIVLLAVLGIVLVPVLGDQLAAFAEKWPGYVSKVQSLLTDPNRAWLAKLVGDRLPEAEKSVGTLAGHAASLVGVFLQSLWSGGRALVSALSLLIITPVVTVYLLFDWDSMVAAIDSWIPRHHQHTVRTLFRDIDRAISGFVRGQALVCLILGIFYSVSLVLIGLHFGLLIGVVAAFLSFIPYVGTLTGFLLAAGVGVAQFWPDWAHILMAVGVFVVGQAVEGNVLQPYLVGKTIGLPPVWLMFSLLAFGYLFGFVGLLVAVPVAAAIGVLARFALRQYLASAYYKGDEPG
jgi:predicted PurR-regulated permease PerM